MSQQQEQLKSLLKGSIPNLILHSDCRPDILKNEKTGNNLEMDLYSPQFNIGFEYQGDVHFRHIKRYNNDPDNSRVNDLLKQDYSIQRPTYNLVIVEIFPQDLGHKNNILNRIESTILYMYNNCYYSRCHQLEKFRLAFRHGLSPLKYKFNPNNVWHKKKRMVVDLDYTDLAKYLGASRLKNIWWNRKDSGWYKIAFHYANENNLLKEYFALSEGMIATKIYENKYYNKQLSS